jgi:hypothetical protein
VLFLLTKINDATKHRRIGIDRVGGAGTPTCAEKLSIP